MKIVIKLLGKDTVRDVLQLHLPEEELLNKFAEIIQLRNSPKKAKKSK